MGPTVAKDREAGATIANATEARYTNFLHTSVLLKESVEMMVLCLHSKTTGRNVSLDYSLRESLPAFHA
jgi:hypothetical protein